MNKSEAKLEAVIDALETLIRHGVKSDNNRTPISCEIIIEDLYELRRLLHEDLHA